MKKLLVILGIILVLLSGCKEDAVTEPTEYEITISGKVVDEGGIALEDCVITLITLSDSNSTTTNGEGRFSFSLISTQIDSATLLTQKDDYEKQTTLIKNLSEDNKQNITISLVKTVIEYEITISGKVVDESGNAIENSEINLVVGKTSFNTNSDFEGFFQFSFISIFPDSFRIVTKMEDYLDQTILYQNLTQDEMKNLDIVLSTKYITISGIITELNENGLQPSANATVIIKSGGAGLFPLQTITDIQGKFVFQASRELPEDTFESFIINVTKPNFEPLSIRYVLPSDSIRTNIALQINKIVNYFPIKVGNKWEYEYYNYTGERHAYKTEGIQNWEISSVESDGKSFILDIYFTGSKIYMHTGIPVDTTYYENHKETYMLKYNDGLITATDEGEDIPNCFYYINFLMPATNNGLVTYSQEGGAWDHIYTYTLSITEGVIAYEYKYYTDMFGSNIKLYLLNFKEGG